MACNAIDLEEKKNMKKWRGYSMPLRRVDAKVAESMYSRTPPVSSAITNINNNHCDTTTYTQEPSKAVNIIFIFK